MEVESIAPRLLGVGKVQDRLGIGRSGVFKLIGTGELPSVKVGRRRLVPESALREYIAGLQETA